ncbi:MAG: TetR family transcriptional regulator [Acidobacteriota bacterium]|nr:TetR family transcriptional regulator [Acidobacteriota bacterium]
MGSDSRSFIETARRSQIIACAIETIAELGYASASLAQIAQRAGISKGVISYHFAGKEELVREIAKEVYQIGAKFIAAHIQAETSARGRLRAYIESNLEFMGRYRKELLALVSILMYARTKKGEMLFDIVAEDPVLQATERIFLDGQQSGEFRAFATRPMAIALRGVIDAAPGKLLGTPDFDLVAYTKEVADLFDIGTRA